MKYQAAAGQGHLHRERIAGDGWGPEQAPSDSEAIVNQDAVHSDENKLQEGEAHIGPGKLRAEPGAVAAMVSIFLGVELALQEPDQRWRDLAWHDQLPEDALEADGPELVSESQGPVATYQHDHCCWQTWQCLRLLDHEELKLEYDGRAYWAPLQEVGSAESV